MLNMADRKVAEIPHRAPPSAKTKESKYPIRNPWISNVEAP